jgi:hypothetical protein
MTQDTETAKLPESGARWQKGLTLLPPVSIADLRKDTEHDPEGAEEFVALIRALRRSDSRGVAL